ncbi:MAG TPA: hypothetical protein VN419_01155 [Humidesulfovibrio sp.]|nr:hypothetical protein [Humidesulfovibrio sp.]
MMETTFAAAAFAERNLGKEASECLGNRAQAKVVSAKAKPGAQRPRPSLKA